jgi:Zn finger protein HypA/HybF involved in hydrogenase expression
MPAKIKIVDVVDKEVENDAYTITNNEVEESKLPVENEPLETTEETTAIIQEKTETTTEEVSTDTATTEPAKKIREQQLVKCEKCGKYVTPKTLKYTHSLKCGVEKYQPGRPKKTEIKINEVVQEEAPPPPAPPPAPPAPVQMVTKDKPPPVQRQPPPKQIVKEVVKSYEDLRKERLTERLKQRAERNINLFKQVL